MEAIMQGDKFLKGKEAMDAFRASEGGEMPSFVETKKVEYSPKGKNLGRSATYQKNMILSAKMDHYRKLGADMAARELVDNPLEEEVSCMVSQYLDALIMQRKVVVYTKTSQE